ncbi:hypothetical protein I546_4660 [Mycobacterium kansasii 732]|nr:hypothetical protein I546_4660 [Mycobacterium kansasii 732]
MPSHETSTCSPGSWDRWVDAETLQITTNPGGLSRSLEDFPWDMAIQIVWGWRASALNP